MVVAAAVAVVVAVVAVVPTVVPAVTVDSGGELRERDLHAQPCTSALSFITWVEWVVDCFHIPITLHSVTHE